MDEKCSFERKHIFRKHLYILDTFIPRHTIQEYVKPLYVRRYYTQASHRALHSVFWPLYFLWHGMKTETGSEY